ncbi:MAG: rcc01693 family protein [Alphaproteobacteria bacterium]
MPWPALMMVGLGVLRMSPQNFWAMTLRELEAAAGGLFGQPVSTTLARADLANLMARFPDTEFEETLK